MVPLAEMRFSGYNTANKIGSVTAFLGSSPLPTHGSDFLHQLNSPLQISNSSVKNTQYHCRRSTVELNP